jgi:hypothetical protein
MPRNAFYIGELCNNRLGLSIVAWCTFIEKSL